MNSPIRWLCFLVAFSSSLEAAELTFAGEWDTTYGHMTLQADGSNITGHYVYAGGAMNSVTGTQDGGKLTFTYTEPGVMGEGRFTLSPDGKSFDGEWRPAGAPSWGKWSGRRAATAARDFSGVWRTDYGMMRLIQTGGKVEGCYNFNGRAMVEGTAKDNALTFTYREPDGTTGQGQFKLSADRASFAGTWKPSRGTGGVWKGRRVEPQAGRIWLVVLEARWETSLRDPEYSYGEMLRQFFTRVPTVAVRHRFFTGRSDFSKWCAELTYLTEPVIFYVSSHGTAAGITVGGEVLDGRFIGEQLRLAPEVKLVHLGACLAMSGAVPGDIRRASGLPAPVSGYTRTADWAGSAVIDFAYLDLVLSRRMPAVEAVKQIKDSVTFANDQPRSGSAIAPAGLKIVE